MVSVFGVFDIVKGQVLVLLMKLICLILSVVDDKMAPSSISFWTILVMFLQSSIPE
jgi:hypothetical protein